MKLKFYLLCVGSAFVLTSCGGHATLGGGMAGAEQYRVGNAMSSVVEFEYDDMSVSNLSTSTQGGSSKTQSASEQKLIRRVRIDLELESNVDLESNAERIQQLALSSGGYTADVSLDNRSSWANGNLLIKVPKDKVDGFLSEIKGLGIKVTSISDSSEDVTMRYVDVQTRLEVQETALRKYKQYLEQADNVEELLSIETKIDSIVADMESYQAQLRVLDSQIDYTEVNVNINCKTSINRDSFWVRAGQRFKSMGYEVGDTLLDGIEWMFNAIIVILCAAIPGILAIRVVMFAITWKTKLHPVKWLKGKFKKKIKEEVRGE